MIVGSGGLHIPEIPAEVNILLKNDLLKIHIL